MSRVLGLVSRNGRSLKRLLQIDKNPFSHSLYPPINFNPIIIRKISPEYTLSLSYNVRFVKLLHTERSKFFS